MTENMKKFLEKVSKDKALAEKAVKLEKEELIALAAELSLTLSDSDFEPQEGVLSEDELVSVMGAGGCGCVLAGGGGGTDEHDGKTYGCACALYGQGGDGSYDDFNCICSAGGIGLDDEEKITVNNWYL